MQLLLWLVFSLPVKAANTRWHSVRRTEGSTFCVMQLITDTQSFQVPFPYSDFQKQRGQICIAWNRFGKEGIMPDIPTPGLRANGSIRFGSFKPIKYGIMGRYRWVPFMQRRNSVYSMRAFSKRDDCH